MAEGDKTAKDRGLWDLITRDLQATYHRLVKEGKDKEAERYAIVLRNRERDRP